ncbi:MAG: chromosomal replication initiator protein DnaA, partial [Hellea sp.]|nr:chromosomal replication initiator protein DnaA [Hellea sp.]
GRLHIAAADAFAVTLSAPTRFIASKIENSYQEELRRLWKKHDQVAPPRDVKIAKPVEAKTTKSPSPSRASSFPRKEFRKADIDALGSAESRDQKGVNRRGRFTFDNFVVGPSNELAVAVARQVANFDIAQYNPIVIYGDNGMGKTHLMYAIISACDAAEPPKNVLKISGEEFVSAFVSSVRGKDREAIEAFKSKIRNVDLLMIDDAHFITNKPSSQEELLHTMISMVGKGRQVLLTTDRHPDELDKASGRMKSHLNSGLVCKIGAADYELRVRILDRLISLRRQNGHPELTVPPKARDLLAARINATPRDLEGAFNQVVAQSEFLGTPITLETIQETLSGSKFMSGMRVTVDKIQRAVAEEFKITLDDMASKRRARAVARPRQVAMYLCKKLTKRSLPDIGRRFGGRDHTTVMHAVKRITQLRADDSVLDGQIKNLEETLRS